MDLAGLLLLQLLLLLMCLIYGGRVARAKPRWPYETMLSLALVDDLNCG